MCRTIQTLSTGINPPPNKGAAARLSPLTVSMSLMLKAEPLRNVSLTVSFSGYDRRSASLSLRRAKYSRTCARAVNRGRSGQ